MGSSIPFADLSTADLVVGANYLSGVKGNASDDPLARLLPVGNQGGFRINGSRASHSYRIAVLYSSGAEPDWPDSLDPETGLFRYFGDNRRPGRALHDTPRGGNATLRFCYDALHATPPNRVAIPPFFVFRKAPVGGRSVEFLGLAVPGAESVQPDEDLVAIWRTTGGERFQNYRALFTVLDVAVVGRTWIEELASGDSLGLSCPKEFRDWVQSGRYRALSAPRTLQHRRVADQQPAGATETAMVKALIDHFSPDPHRFEECAVDLWRMIAKESVSTITATRRSADGGRDAFGLYSIGPVGDRVHLDFSLEAKCYALGHGAGVKEVARLISRLRHRQFGVFVTTSYLGEQAYRELREDGHPVVVIAARDIGDLLLERYGTVDAVRSWLMTKFPMAIATPSTVLGHPPSSGITSSSNAS
jgi:AspBHI-like restriction endonuclease/restriction endonuclease